MDSVMSILARKGRVGRSAGRLRRNGARLVINCLLLQLICKKKNNGKKSTEESCDLYKGQLSSRNTLGTISCRLYHHN